MSKQRASDEEQIWKTSTETTSYIVSKTLTKAQTINLPQKFGQFSSLAQYYAQHYARSPYATGIVLTTAGAVIGAPELSALGLVGGCSQAIAGSINDLGTNQQRELVKTIAAFDQRVETFDRSLSNQQDQLRKTLHTFGDTVATIDDRVITLNKIFKDQQQELTKTFDNGAKILVAAGKDAGSILDERIKIADQTLTNQQNEFRKTLDPGTESIERITRGLIQETVSHAGRTAVQSLAYGASIALGANFVYRNLSKEVITNKELSLAALGGVMIAAPVYFSTRTMSPNPLDSRVVN